MCGWWRDARICRSSRNRRTPKPAHEPVVDFQAAPDQLERDALPEVAVVALGEVHDAHATASELADDAVWSHARLVSVRGAEARDEWCRELGGRRREEGVCTLTRVEEPDDFVIELAIDAARVTQERLARLAGLVEHRVEQRFDRAPVLTDIPRLQSPSRPVGAPHSLDERRGRGADGGDPTYRQALHPASADTRELGTRRSEDPP
jgi:hypothetical protein